MENILHIEVPLLKNVRDSAPASVYLDAWLSSNEYKSVIEKLRALPEEKQKEFKSNLPCILPSLQINKEGQTEHSGLIGVDVDFKDNASAGNFKDLKKLVRLIDCVACCILSARGEGYFLLIPISNPDKHKEHFKSLEIDFARCGIKIDPSCSDVSRKRFCTWDPEPYVNLKAKTYKKIAFTILPTIDSFSDSPCIDRVEALILEIEDRVIDITVGHGPWLRIGFALANTFGEDPGREFFQRLSMWSDQYEATNVDRQFTNCLKAQDPEKKKIHINTLFYIAKEYGVIISGPEVDFKLN